MVIIAAQVAATRVDDLVVDLARIVEVVGADHAQGVVVVLPLRVGLTVPLRDVQVEPADGVAQRVIPLRWGVDEWGGFHGLALRQVAHQDVLADPAQDAVFEYLPDQLIAYEDASYAQFMNVQMDSSASLVTAEIVTPGWSPDGTRFKFQDVRLHTTVEVDGKLAVLDNLLILPGSSEFTEDSILYMEDQTHVGSLLAVDRRIDAELLDELREYLAGVEFKETVRFGVTLIDGPGLALRSLGTLTEDLYLLNTEVANFLRAKFRNQPRLHLRKY